MLSRFLWALLMMARAIASALRDISKRINDLKNKMLSLSLCFVTFHKPFWIVTCAA
ncbi:conserved exported hypothetical protein [Klebsiella grimontii]|uniref:Uncharacterized protein n=1 Tax=Klebsiella grimontii TaxID=2058152 RepID=A0A285B3D5_9ENTR|nr:conserved exported hypothetical protein [Klebsiella grimontii]